MVMLSILAAHEQVNPVDLLRDVIEMEQNGIEKVLDYWSLHALVAKWSFRRCCFALHGAALAKTNWIVIGIGITPPIPRYHPGIVAHVFADVAFMFKKSFSFSR